jgi:hypothetical protein
MFFPGLLFVSTSTINVYQLIPGNWTEKVNNFSQVYPIQFVEETVGADGENVTTFMGEYNGVDVVISVTSNTTGRASYGPLSLDFKFTDAGEDLAIAEAEASDGSHLSILAYDDCTLEMSVFAKELRELHTYAFFKAQPRRSRAWEAVIPVVCAIAAVWGLKKFFPGIFG